MNLAPTGDYRDLIHFQSDEHKAPPRPRSAHHWSTFLSTTPLPRAGVPLSSVSSLRLLANGIISLLWGIALVIFASGVVPVDWVISQYGKDHPDMINALVALIGTASTTHIKYTFQGILDHYSHYMLVDGFTLNQLTWMQGIMEWPFFAVTAFESHRKRAVWLVLYIGMALHSASVVSVLQPNTFYKTISYNNPVPCGTDSSSLSLGVADNLPQDIQSQIDQLSHGVGFQFGDYVGKSHRHVMPRPNA